MPHSQIYPALNHDEDPNVTRGQHSIPRVLLQMTSCGSFIAPGTPWLLSSRYNIAKKRTTIYKIQNGNINNIIILLIFPFCTNTNVCLHICYNQYHIVSQLLTSGFPAINLCHQRRLQIILKFIGQIGIRTICMWIFRHTYMNNLFQKSYNKLP